MHTFSKLQQVSLPGTPSPTSSRLAAPACVARLGAGYGCSGRSKEIKIASNMTPVLQLTDTDIAYPLKAAAERQMRHIEQAEKKKVSVIKSLSCKLLNDLKDKELLGPDGGGGY